MPHSRETLEMQLKQAQARLEALERKLDEEGVAADARRKEPRWRSLNAECADLQGRLDRVAEKEKQNAELSNRKK